MQAAAPPLFFILVHGTVSVLNSSSFGSAKHCSPLVRMLREETGARNAQEVEAC